MTQASNNNAFVFGGVFDMEENEEDIAGTFLNDLYCLDMEKLIWRQVVLTDKREKNKKKKDESTANKDEVKEESMEIETPQVVADDGVFTVTIGPASTCVKTGNSVTYKSDTQIFQPPPRMNCGLAIKHGILYLYGGMIEEGNKQFTMTDFYSLGNNTFLFILNIYNEDYHCAIITFFLFLEGYCIDSIYLHQYFY